jgi:hypothetical protein
MIVARLVFSLLHIPSHFFLQVKMNFLSAISQFIIKASDFFFWNSFSEMSLLKIAILLFLMLSFASQGQYIKMSTLASFGPTNGAFASQVIGQSSVAVGGSSNFREGFKQPLGANQKTFTTSMIRSGEVVKWCFQAFPNPFKDKLTVLLNGTTNLLSRLVLYDFEAKIIWEGAYKENQTEIHIDQLQGIRAGKYILQVFHHGKPQTVSLIKEIN